MGTWLFVGQRGAGLVSMFLLFGAFVALADALVGGLKGEQGLIDLLPGDTFTVRAPMPLEAKTLADMVIDGQPADDSVRLEPQELFTGYWLGGNMWRGLVVIESFALPGKYLLWARGKNAPAGKKTPILASFTVRVWANQADLTAHSPSWLTRFNGMNPFVVAAVFAVSGLAFGGCNIAFGQLWRRNLARCFCGEIYRLRKTEKGVEASCEIEGEPPPVGATVAVRRVLGEKIAIGHVLSSENNEIVALLLDGETMARLGDVLCYGADDE